MRRSCSQRGWQGSSRPATAVLRRDDGCEAGASVPWAAERLPARRRDIPWCRGTHAPSNTPSTARSSLQSWPSPPGLHVTRIRGMRTLGPVTTRRRVSITPGRAWRNYCRCADGGGCRWGGQGSSLRPMDDESASGRSRRDGHRARHRCADVIAHEESARSSAKRARLPSCFRSPRLIAAFVIGRNQGLSQYGT